MLPNILTFFRIISAPILVVILMSTEFKMVLAGLAIFIISSLTDFLDGYLARSLLSLVSNNIIQETNILAATLIIIREIFISGLREYARGNSLTVSFLAKVKTFTQFIAIILLIPSGILELNFQFIGLTFLWVSAILSLFTAYQYVRISLNKNIL